METSASNIWSSGANAIIAEAERNGLPVTLRCTLLRDGTPTDLALTGVVHLTQGREGLLVVRDTITLSSKSRGAGDWGEISFQLPEDTGRDRPSALGVRGMAAVLGAQADGDAVRQVTLRFPNKYTTRPLRKSRRYAWRAEYTRLAGVLLPVGIPATKDALRALLNAHYKRDPTPTTILDISAGGVRVCLPDDLAKPAFASASLYVVFFVPSKADKGEQPFVFLAKRMGLSPERCASGTAVRLCFVAEMDWGAPRNDIHWSSILQEGSARLGECLQRYDADDCPPQA